MQGLVSSINDGLGSVASGVSSGVNAVGDGIRKAGESSGGTERITTDLRDVKIVLLGDSSVGKTTLIYQYVNRHFLENPSPSLGADLFVKEVHIRDRLLPFKIWDTSGGAQPFGYVLYRGAHCCLLAFDVTNRRSFEALSAWRDEFLVQASPKNASAFPFIVVGCKCDAPNRAVSQRDAMAWCERHGDAPYLEVSAKENINVEQVFKKALHSAVSAAREDS